MWGDVGGLASAAGVLLASAGMLALVYALVQAPTVGGARCVAGGRIVEIDVLADPERLRTVDLSVLDG